MGTTKKKADVDAQTVRIGDEDVAREKFARK
jgi:hypothetical protein